MKCSTTGKLHTKGLGRWFGRLRGMWLYCQTDEMWVWWEFGGSSGPWRILKQAKGYLQDDGLFMCGNWGRRQGSMFGRCNTIICVLLETMRFNLGVGQLKLLQILRHDRDGNRSSSRASCATTHSFKNIKTFVDIEATITNTDYIVSNDILIRSCRSLLYCPPTSQSKFLQKRCGMRSDLADHDYGLGITALIRGKA